MKFYFYSNYGERQELTEDEVRKHLSPGQIEDAIAAKIADPLEEVSYMTLCGTIHCEID